MQMCVLIELVYTVLNCSSYVPTSILYSFPLLLVEFASDSQLLEPSNAHVPFSLQVSSAVNPAAPTSIQAV